MTFYGIERQAGAVKVCRWRASTARAPREAMEWAYYPNEGEPIKKRHRELYMVPKGWRCPKGLSTEDLAQAIERLCSDNH